MVARRRQYTATSETRLNICHDSLHFDTARYVNIRHAGEEIAAEDGLASAICNRLLACLKEAFKGDMLTCYHA